MCAVPRVFRRTPACRPANGREVIATLYQVSSGILEIDEAGDWDVSPVIDKHCVGGLPGNRTTPIVVAIVAAHGLTMPKTSSRAITSPAGTADTMETLAPVDLGLEDIRRVVEQESAASFGRRGAPQSCGRHPYPRRARPLDIDLRGSLSHR